MSALVYWIFRGSLIDGKFNLSIVVEPMENVCLRENILKRMVQKENLFF